MSGGINRLIARIAPGLALAREINQTKLAMLQDRRATMTMSGSYAATGGRRSGEFRKNRHDANEALRGERSPMAWIARDMLRNNPRVVRANGLIANYTVGAGIVPTIQMRSGEEDQAKKRIEGLLRDHMLTTSLDADGNSTLYGLQKLAMRTIPTSGEVMVRRRLRRSRDPFVLPFQIQCLETDFINPTMNRAGAGQNRIDEGIEYNALGQRAAFWLYTQHPGSKLGTPGNFRRVDARNVGFGFDPLRPGQGRGVTWYAPIMPLLLDLLKLNAATLKRQEVAAMFAGVISSGDDLDDDSNDIKELEAGGIMPIGKDEEITFSDPPDAAPAEMVERMIARTMATALMLTYSSFSGDYSQHNYSSHKAERNDQDPAIFSWQNEIMIAQICHKIGGWFQDAIQLTTGIEARDYRVLWTPPTRAISDPRYDWKAHGERLDRKFASRHQIIRETGGDPEKVDAEIKADPQADTGAGTAGSDDGAEEKANRDDDRRNQEKGSGK